MAFKKNWMKQKGYIVVYICIGLTLWGDCSPQKLFVFTIESLYYIHTKNKLINTYKFVVSTVHG